MMKINHPPGSAHIFPPDLTDPGPRGCMPCGPLPSDGGFHNLVLTMAYYNEPFAKMEGSLILMHDVTKHSCQWASATLILYTLLFGFQTCYTSTFIIRVINSHDKLTYFNSVDLPSSWWLARQIRKENNE